MRIDPLSAATIATFALLTAALAVALTLEARARSALRTRLERERQEFEQHWETASAQWRQAEEREIRARLELEEQVAALETRAEQIRREWEHLLDVRIPALLHHLRTPHVVIPGMLHAELAGGDVDRVLRAVLDAITRGVREEHERVDEAAQAVTRGAMSRIQVMALRAQDLLVAAQHRFSENIPLLLELMELDKHNELMVRRAQVTAVATGGTVGLVRGDTFLIDMIMGAIGRVENFATRIALPANHLGERTGVAARAAEPVLVIIGELLANAVHHSHGSLPVTITAHRVDNGAVVIVEDAGVGMAEEQFRYAERVLSGAHTVELTEMGDPARTGWAAIGRLVQQYGMHVTLGISRFGGVEAALYLPNRLLVEMPADARPHPMSPSPTTKPSRTSTPVPLASLSLAPARRDDTDPAPARTGVVITPDFGGDGVDAAEVAGDGLPQRRRRRPPAPGRITARPGADPPALTPEQARTRWRAFQAGITAARAITDTDDDPTASAHANEGN